MSYYFHEYYLKTLHIFNYLNLDCNLVHSMKLFQKNKFMCLTNKNYLNYNILNNKLLYNATFWINDEKFEEIEIIDYDKFILYNGNILVLFKYIENENNCLELLSKKIFPFNNNDNDYDRMKIIYNNKNFIISKINVYIFYYKR